MVLARRFSPSINQAAQQIARKFSVAFELFAKCHCVHDKSQVSAEEVTTLGEPITVYLCINCTSGKCILLPYSEQSIASFMKYYRETFDKATVTPKLHMLEKHTLPWLKEWGVGFGLMGEQGAESIHRWFNSQKLGQWLRSSTA